ncbi:MAG: NrfD/PsrC family molybdoenzyme membrane anchor subunit [Pseudomonadota bacterium]
MSDVQKTSIWTPANIITAIILAVGLGITILRFTTGIGAVTNLDDNNPWGLWIGFDLLCGVALAAGGYVTSASCYLFGLKRYHSAVRPAITTAFLGYFFVVIALTYDLGHPLRLPIPIFWSQGTTSLLFEVGLCVATYLTVLFIEWCPAALEWLGFRKIRNVVVKLTLVLTIFGVVLSTLHQSSLGALFLIAPSKLHPLWYSPFLPVFFFMSSWVAGVSMVIFEGTLAHKPFHHKMDETHLKEADGVVLGFGKAGAFILAGYFMVKVIDTTMDNDWHYLSTGWGAWWLVEMIGFVALPSFLYALGVREKSTRIIRIASFFAVAGIILNRLNVSLVAFNWQLPSAERYFPHWMEIAISIFIVTCIVTAYRFIATKMPVLYEHPDYKDSH